MSYLLSGLDEARHRLDAIQHRAHPLPPPKGAPVCGDGFPIPSPEQLEAEIKAMPADERDLLLASVRTTELAEELRYGNSVIIDWNYVDQRLPDVALRVLVSTTDDDVLEAYSYEGKWWTPRGDLVDIEVFAWATLPRPALQLDTADTTDDEGGAE